MSDHGLWRDYAPPGPKAHGWLYSEAEDFAGIIGPYGSAKTTTGAMKCIRTTCRQHPSTKDGRRKALITAVRPNYRRMHDTLIPSVQNFFGKDAAWEGPKNGPQDAFLRWEEPGLGLCELLIQFRAIGDDSIQSFVRGYQPTAWWTNEFDELPDGSLSKFRSRTGRYKLNEKLSRADLARSMGFALDDEAFREATGYCRVFGDTNMPDLDNWVHERLLKAPRKGVEIFLQPSGLSPDAENLVHLHKDDPLYYENMKRGFEEDGDFSSARRFIENLPGYTPSGQPVYPAFRYERHIGPATLRPDPMKRLIIGVDQGGQAAAVIGQKLAPLIARLYREIVLPEGAFLGGEEFGKLLGRVMLDEFRRFLQPGGFIIRMDPAAKQRHSGTKQDDPRHWAYDFIDGFEAETGFANTDWDIAATNISKRRVAAVRKLLAWRDPSTGAEGLQIHPDMTVTARGFAGGYRHTGVQGKPGEYHPEPDKNRYSNPHDAVQYFALEIAPEAAGLDIDKTDRAALMAASAFDAGRPSWNDDRQPTEILF